MTLKRTFKKNILLKEYLRMNNISVADTTAGSTVGPSALARSSLERRLCT